MSTPDGGLRFPLVIHDIRSVHCGDASTLRGPCRGWRGSYCRDDATWGQIMGNSMVVNESRLGGIAKEARQYTVHQREDAYALLPHAILDRMQLLPARPRHRYSTPGGALGEFCEPCQPTPVPSFPHHV